MCPQGFVRALMGKYAVQCNMHQLPSDGGQLLWFVSVLLTSDRYPIIFDYDQYLKGAGQVRTHAGLKTENPKRARTLSWLLTYSACNGTN